MTNIAELLKDAPKGMELYSPLFGEVHFDKVSCVGCIEVIVTCDDGAWCVERFYPDGIYRRIYPSAECLLFPSKEVRTWEGWTVPKPHYDIANFHAGMPVLVRDRHTECWTYLLFSHIEKGVYPPFIAGAVSWKQCIPFEGNEHLLGTSDMCPEEYINW